jgi:disulfide bond formation protein DsbB
MSSLSNPGLSTAGRSWARGGPLVVLLFSIATLGIALIAQYGFGLRPCALCIWQRWPYAATILLSALAVILLKGGTRTAALLLALCCGAFLIGAGIAGFHVGVEQHWWSGTAACAGAAGGNSLEALRAQIVGAPVVRCDEAAWSLFGISMAGWNLLASLAYAALSAAAAWRLWQST